MDGHELRQIENKVGKLLHHGSPSCISQAHNIMHENFEVILRFALRLLEPEPKPAHTIADNYPAGGLTSTEPCMFCVDYNELEEKYDKLKASHNRQNILLNRCAEWFNRHCGHAQLRLYEEIKQALAESEKL